MNLSKVSDVDGGIEDFYEATNVDDAIADLCNVSHVDVAV